MRAGASYNYLLVDGKRRMTEREMLRLQGFPDSYKIVCRYAETRKQAGNSVAVPCIQAVIGEVLSALSSEPVDRSVCTFVDGESGQMTLPNSKFCCEPVVLS
jgi:DNA (cytosine-5)-methyltransferase 1